VRRNPRCVLARRAGIRSRPNTCDDLWRVGVSLSAKPAGEPPGSFALHQIRVSVPRKSSGLLHQAMHPTWHYMCVDAPRKVGSL
jgi:hypothetical protein